MTLSIKIMGQEKVAIRTRTDKMAKTCEDINWSYIASTLEDYNTEVEDKEYSIDFAFNGKVFRKLTAANYEALYNYIVKIYDKRIKLDWNSIVKEGLSTKINKNYGVISNLDNIN